MNANGRLRSRNGARFHSSRNKTRYTPRLITDYATGSRWIETLARFDANSYVNAMSSPLLVHSTFFTDRSFLFPSVTRAFRDVCSLFANVRGTASGGFPEGLASLRSDHTLLTLEGEHLFGFPLLSCVRREHSRKVCATPTHVITSNDVS